MIATVTLNPAVDKSVLVRGFEVGKTNRSEVTRLDAGGKGINVAKTLKRLGAPVCALGLIAGSNGRFILDALAAEGISTDFVTVPGETRVNLKVRDPERNTETELNEPGFQVDATSLAALRRKIAAKATECRVVVFSGSLPPGAPVGIFAELIGIAKGLGAKCLLDTAGPALHQGLIAAPWLVKPNRAEAEELLQTTLGTSGSLVHAAQTLVTMGAEQVLISLGAQGAVAASGGTTLYGSPPKVAVRSTVGAGDAMVAAMAYAALEGSPFPAAFRLAIAAGAATVATEGTAVADLTAVQALLPQVVVEDVGAQP
jgi:1-phosphofructokinase